MMMMMVVVVMMMMMMMMIIIILIIWPDCLLEEWKKLCYLLFFVHTCHA